MDLHFLERGHSMREIFDIVNRGYILYVMTGIFLFGIVCGLFLNCVYYYIEKDVYGLSLPKGKLVKQIKLKYESCKELGMEIKNTKVFVRKSIYEHRACGMHLHMIENIQGQAVFWGLIVGIVTSVYAFSMKMGQNIVITYISTTGVFAAILYSSIKLSDIKYKKEMVETGILDLLENHVNTHVLCNNQNKYIQEKEENKVLEFKADDILNIGNNSLEEKHDKEKDDNEAKNTIENNIIIEEVLREFFG